MTDFYYTRNETFDSTFADEAYYDEQSGRLAILTISGDTLVYVVPREIAMGFIDSDSQGRFFQRYIRGAYSREESSYYQFFVERDNVTTAPVSVSVDVPDADEDFSLGRYSVIAYFHSLEDAYAAFDSVSKTGAYVTLTAGESDE